MKYRKAGQFFFAASLEGDRYMFDTFESRHIVKVLRKQTGDILFLTDGKGNIAKGKIILSSRNKAGVELVEKISEPEPTKKLHVYIAPTKSVDRFEWFLEKATELGVWEITPVLTRYTQRAKLNYERLEKIIVSAVKQSLRAYKPRLNRAVKLSELHFENKDFFAALCDGSLENTGKFAESTNAAILIGPEGGFSTDEKDFIKQNGLIPVKLNGARLRTETAGIAAVCLFNLKI